MSSVHRCSGSRMFERNYTPSKDIIYPYEIYPIGDVDSGHIHDWPNGDGVRAMDRAPRGDRDCCNPDTGTWG
ncbi:hypothetical protein BDV12DRAFT_178420 [Aspergillus spectabilis]